MRLWHKDLISVLPRQQLIAQWRECCAIAKDWAKKGKTNHILINKVMNYPVSELYSYTFFVIDEIRLRKYKVLHSTIQRFTENICEISRNTSEQVVLIKNKKDIFQNWHTSRYYQQCYYNLEEKFDCGGLTKEEWNLITDKTMEMGIF